MADIGITKFRVQIPRGGATPSTPGFAQSEGQDPVNPPGSPTGIYVPYLGATGAVNLGEFGLTTGNLKFDLTPTNIPTDQGTTYWDDSKQTVALIMNGTTQHIGQDQFIYVKNSSGSPIAKGVAVRNSGTDGGSGHILIEPMLANGTNASETFLGVTAEAIANGSFGQVQAFGELAGINTSTYTAGAFLYVSTTVAGQFQTTAPVAPNNIILVGRAINSKNNGDIFIRPHIGSNIRNDEGVKITSPTTGDLLQLQAGGLWENKSLATIGIPTGSGANDRVTFWTGASTIGSDSSFVWDNTNKRLGIGTNSPLSPIHISANTNISVGYRVNNTSNGTAAVAGIDLISNAAQGSLFATSSGYTTFGVLAPSSVGFYTTTTFAIAIDSNSADFKVGIGSGGPVERFRIFRSTGNALLQNGGTFTDAGFRLDVNGTLRSQGDFTLSDNRNIVLGTTTGTKIGTATSQKIGFWNATPIVQPTTAVASATLVGNAGTNITDTDTFDGYTLAQIVKALRNAGLLA